MPVQSGSTVLDDTIKTKLRGLRPRPHIHRVSVPCKLCQKRRARRHCPGAAGEICPQCCGSERENTIDCPLTCEYLREARQHEALPPVNEADVPNMDIRLSEKFIREQEPLVFALALALKRAMEAGNAVDLDAREALEAAIQTYRTLQSGLIYESRPSNPYAMAIQDKLKEGVEELRQGLRQQGMGEMIRDADVLGVLVFLQRLERQHSNGRRRGRAFFDFLRGYLPEPEGASAPPVVIP
jgi:hypothetical protein